MIDFLNISFPKSEIDLSSYIKTVFNVNLTKKNEKYDFLYAQGIEGLTVVSFHTHRHIQLSGEFWQRANAFNEAQKIYKLLNEQIRTTIARVDIARDFIGESVTDLLKPKYANSKYFPGGENTFKPVVYGGNNPETITFLSRHRKLRLYDKIRQIQFLVEKNLAKPHHFRILRAYAATGVTRFEVELRSNFALYADSIFQICVSPEEFESQVLNNYLKENPMVTDSGKLQPLWARLQNPELEKIIGEQRPKREVNQHRMSEDIRRSQSLIANKFKKWGFSELEAFKFLLNAFGFEGILDYSPIDERESFYELKAEVELFRMKYGPLESASPQGVADERWPKRPSGKGS